MEQYKPFQKNRNFYLGVGCTILEGLLSGCNFMILYSVMQMLLQKNFYYSRSLPSQVCWLVFFSCVC